MDEDPNGFDSDDDAILEIFGVRKNVDGRAVITEESDSIPDDETGMLMQSDEELDQFSDDEMANMEEKSIKLSASEVILASCALAPENAASKVMRQRNHSLQQDFNSGRRVVDSICEYMNRRVEYLCRVCLRGTQNSTTTCCESREIWRSKRSQMITVVSFSAVHQITHIFEKNEKEIVEIHKEVHRVRAGSATRTRSDLHSSESYMDGVETKSQFDRKEITLNLSLSMDSYPFFRAGRGSATPLLISIQDLPARLRNKPENIAMQCIVGSRGGKLRPSLWKTILSQLMDSLNGSISINGWKVSLRLRTSILDADGIREHYNHKGWAGYHGCFYCLHPGKNVVGTVKFPPWQTMGVTKPPGRNLFNVMSHSRMRTHGFKGGSHMHQFLPLMYAQLDALHLLDLGFAKDILAACQDSESPLYIGANHNQILSEICVSVPHDWANVRVLNDQKLTGTELSVHSISTLMFLSINDALGKSTRIAFLAFAISTYLWRLRSRTISDRELSEIEKMALIIENLLITVCGEKSFTYKIHCALTHVPDRIDSFGLPDDYTMHPYESINRLLSTGRNNSSSRGYETHAATRFVVNSYLTRELPELTSTQVEKKQLDIMFGQDNGAANLMPPPNKSINIVSLAKSVLGSELSMQEGRGLVQEKLKLICQGQLAIVDSVDSTTATTMYSSAEERLHLDSLWKYGMAELVNYNMEMMAGRLGQSETAVSSVQSKIAKQVSVVGYRFDIDRLRSKVVPVAVPGKPGLIVDLYSLMVSTYVIPDLCGEKIWRNFARACILTIMPTSFIRLYSLSSKNKTEYYKLPQEVLNAIKSAICVASHFNDAKTKNMFPSVNTVVDSAITQLFYDSRKSKPGWSIRQWQELAMKDGWCAPGTQSEPSTITYEEGTAKDLFLKLTNHVLSGVENIPEGNETNYDIPVELERSEVIDESAEVDVVTVSETPKRFTERGNSLQPKQKKPKINGKFTIPRRGGVKVELIDSPSTQVERPSYTDLSTEKIAFQHPEVNAASSSSTIGFLSPEANYSSSRTIYDYSDPLNSNITRL